MSSMNRLGVARPSNSESTGINGLSAQGSTILDTLKKKMSQLKEELEVSKDELEKNRRILDEEKKRRECVSFESEEEFCGANPLGLLNLQSELFKQFFLFFFRLSWKCLLCKDVSNCWKKIWKRPMSVLLKPPLN